MTERLIVPALNHRVRSWWRYSGISGYRLALQVLFVVRWWVHAALSHDTGALVVAVLLIVALLGVIGVGAFRAERTCRYGCW